MRVAGGLVYINNVIGTIHYCRWYLSGWRAGGSPLPTDPVMPDIFLFLIYYDKPGVTFRHTDFCCLPSIFSIFPTKMSQSVLRAASNRAMHCTGIFRFFFSSSRQFFYDFSRFLFLFRGYYALPSMYWRSCRSA